MKPVHLLYIGLALLAVGYVRGGTLKYSNGNPFNGTTSDRILMGLGLKAVP